MLEAARWHEDPLARVVVTMMLDTGLRVAEICDLDLDAVDVDDQSAMVRSGKGDKDRLVLFTERTLHELERGSTTCVAHGGCVGTGVGEPTRSTLTPRAVNA